MALAPERGMKGRKLLYWLHIDWTVSVRTWHLAVAVAAAATIAGPSWVAAQGVVAPDAALEAMAQQQYEAVKGSIVCIRTVVKRDLPMVVPQTGLMGMIKSPVALHGTGVVIDSVAEGGHTEYVILTNDHVASPSLYFDVHSRFLTASKEIATSRPKDVEEASYIVDSSNDDDPSDDVALRVIARNPAGDAALLETVGATRPLTVFHGRIGFPGSGVAPGALVITSGFPFGDRLNTAFGRLLDLHYDHALGIPHVDYSVDTPLEPGQSGSPVFLVTETKVDGKPQAQFSLIGLLHAQEHGVHLMTPYSVWGSTLAALPGHNRAGSLLGGM